MKGIDPTGGKSPIYDQAGSFLGTDSQGLQGEGIIMHSSQFVQGMSHESALEVGLTFSQYSALNIDIETSAEVFSHMQTLPNRPDWDGFVTIQEGVAWSLANPRAVHYPDANNSLYLKYCFVGFWKISRLMTFHKPNATTAINLFNVSNFFHSVRNPILRAIVYALGRVNMELVNFGSREVRIINDEATDYDWNMGDGFLRSTLILEEHLRTGVDGRDGFRAIYYGIGTLRTYLANFYEQLKENSVCIASSPFAWPLSRAAIVVLCMEKNILVQDLCRSMKMRIAFIYCFARPKLVAPLGST